MRLTRSSCYAVHALAHLAAAGPDRRVAAQAIAGRRGISESFLAKILKALASAHLVHSIQGQGGGCRLVRPAARITLLEIVEAVDGPIRGEAPVVSQARDRLDARLQEVCEEVAGLVRRRLGRVRLSDLAGKR
jgi:Rrf2 family protein